MTPEEREQLERDYNTFAEIAPFHPARKTTLGGMEAAIITLEEFGAYERLAAFARQQLAREPVGDDGVEVDNQFLESLGKLQVGEFELCKYLHSDWDLYVENPTEYYGCSHTVSIPRPKTRGDVRRLCEALGIPLTRAADGGGA